MADRPPSPGDEATPFLLRVYVKPAPFRPLDDFLPNMRPARDEFKLHVWKTNTLREVAQMLYNADPSISTPLALHAFRRIRWNPRQRDFEATPVGVGITRVPLNSIVALLSDLDGVPPGDQDMDTSDSGAAHANDSSLQSVATTLGWDELKDEIDEGAAAVRIADIDLIDGDLLDCVIKSDPSLALAPKPPRPSGRDRPIADRTSHPRR